MDVDAFIANHPQLFHMAQAGSWPQIERIGLLSTTALLDYYGVTGAERFAIESRRRPASVVLTHPHTGEQAVIRDNIPLNERFLDQVLTDMTPEEWYRHLNSRVFFWVREEKLRVLLNARAYRNHEHDVLTVDTRSLLAQHHLETTLAPINTGAAFSPTAARRGSDTFASIADYPLAERVRWRGTKDAITELAVSYKVDDIAQHVIKVERRRQDSVLEVLR